MKYRIVNDMLVCPVPKNTGLSDENIERIVNNTADTMVERSVEKIRENTIRGKRAERAIEQYVLQHFDNRVCYLSYDEIRNDKFLCHAPFDGLFYKPDVPQNLIDRFVDEIRKEIEQTAPYGKISADLRNRLVDNGIFTFEIKSSELNDRGRDKTNIISDYQGVTPGGPRTQADYEAITKNILARWDFFIFPHYCRHTDNEENVRSFYDYVEFIRAHNGRYAFPAYDSYSLFLEPLIRGEFDNTSEIQTRIYFDLQTNELYIPGYIHKQYFFCGVPTITRMPGSVSGNTLYFTRSIKHYRNSFVNMPNDDNIWTYDRSAAYDKLYYNHNGTDEFTCPRCGKLVRHGKYGYFCTNKCGMRINNFFGALDDEPVIQLLQGKTARLTRSNGRTDILTPSIIHNVYNNSLVYMWKKA